MTSGRLHSVVNFIGFQASWFACILGAASGRPWLGPIVVGATVAVHLALVVDRAGRRAEIALLAVAAIVGYLADSALVLTGVFSFPESASLGGPSAIWMVALWVNFAATLRWSMRWMRGRWIVAAVFGAVGGPLAYFAGARFGAVTFDGGLGRGLGLVALEWIVATPLLVWLSAMVERCSMLVSVPRGAEAGEGAP